MRPSSCFLGSFQGSCGKEKGSSTREPWDVLSSYALWSHGKKTSGPSQGWVDQVGHEDEHDGKPQAGKHLVTCVLGNGDRSR